MFASEIWLTVVMTAPVVFCCRVNCADAHTSALPRGIVSVTEQ
ncbi:hypothetical protein MC04F17_46740 [Escherichia coli]